MSILSPLHTQQAPAPDTSRRALAEGLCRARARHERVLVSVAERVSRLDPLAAFAAGAASGQERQYWEHQEHDGSWLALAGIGVAHAIVAEGPERFDAVAAAWRALLDDALIEAPTDRAGIGPLLMGGAAFDPLRPRTATWQRFPDALFILPRFTIATTGTECWLTTNVLLDPDEDIEAITETTLRARAELLLRAQHHGDPALAVGSCHGGFSPRLSSADSQIDDLLPGAHWHDAVAGTARDIRAGHFTKVVLARQARLRFTGEARVGSRAVRALARLRAGYPGSFLFAIARPGREIGDEAIFLGASPERLLRLRDGIVEATCLAGSIRRGATPDEDARLGQELLASAKNRHEHAVVATMLRETLAPVCQTLEMPEAPTLLRLPTVQHLYTPIQGRTLTTEAQRHRESTEAEESRGHGNRPWSSYLPSDRGPRLPTILDLVQRLHPTPAVGGVPRTDALTAIREREGLDRGWYASPVGWLDRYGGGEFAVAIRSALLHQSPSSPEGEGLLIAGCGIMGDSDPESEYQESRIKMRVMLSALSD